MSYAHFEEPIECPECGYHTQELIQITSEQVLMCEGCYAELLEHKKTE